MADRTLQVRRDKPRIRWCIYTGLVASFWVVGLFAILTGTS